MAIIYRPASSQDAGAVRKIATRAFKYAWTRQDVGRQLKNFNVRVLTQDEVVVGFAIFECTDAATVGIGTFAIHHEYRGQGLGHRLITELVAELKEYPNVWLFVRKRNKVARRLYTSAGFYIEKSENSNVYLMRLAHRNTPLQATSD